MSKYNKLIISTINAQSLSIKSKIFNASSLITPIKSSYFDRCERLLRSVNVLTSNEVNAYFGRSKTTLLKSFIEHQLMRAKSPQTP